MVIRPLVFVCCALLTASPAIAHPTVIAELGTAPLLGTSVSTTQFRARVADNDGVLSVAATRVGLSPREYHAFREAVASSHVAWVAVPRHLDAMTWRSGDHVYVIRDVVIPAHTNGWEVDVAEPHAIAKIYLPAACGNLSIVRTPLPVVAHVAPRIAPVAAPVVAVAAPPVAEPPAPVRDDVPAPAEVASASDFPAAAAAHHASPFIPILFGIAALAGALAPGGGQSAPVVNCGVP